MAANWQEVLGWSDGQIHGIRSAGYSFIRQGLYKEAITFFEALIAMDPANAYDNQTLGALFLQIGENQKALEQIDKALAIDPSNLPTRLNKCKVLLVLGRRDEGLALAQELVSLQADQVSNIAEALVMAYQ